MEKEREEDIMEGEELKRLAAQYEIERAKLEEIRKEEAKGLMLDNQRQIEDVKKMREIHVQNEEVSRVQIYSLLFQLTDFLSFFF